MKSFVFLLIGIFISGFETFQLMTANNGQTILITSVDFGKHNKYRYCCRQIGKYDVDMFNKIEFESDSVYIVGDRLEIKK